jgi:hypothetical protein
MHKRNLFLSLFWLVMRANLRVRSFQTALIKVVVGVISASGRQENTEPHSVDASQLQYNESVRSVVECSSKIYVPENRGIPLVLKVCNPSYNFSKIRPNLFQPRYHIDAPKKFGESP